MISTQDVLDILRAPGRPTLGVNALLDRLGVQRRRGRGLRATLRQLERDGLVERVDRRYRMARADGWIECDLARDDSGGGRAADAAGRIWLLPDVRGAHTGDRVLVAPIGDRSRGRAELVEVLSGDRDTWIGVLDRRGGRAVVTPYPASRGASRSGGDWIFHIAARDGRDARSGEVVEVEPLRRTRKPRRDREPRGRIVARLGRPGEPEADVRALAWTYRLPIAFSPAAQAESEAIPDAIDPDEIARRNDLRTLPWITIDPASARDHDDAVCVEPLGRGGARLWVAIADVAHFVPEGSALDRDALGRGNSVYFPDRAIPMLPERLSSRLCSLRPDEDHLALAVALDVRADGRVERAAFHAAVVRVRARLDYAQAAAAMERDEAAELPDKVHEQLRALDEVTGRLRERRLREGSLDFELPEAEPVFDDDGRPVDARRAVRTAAHRAVEDAMLAANRAVAQRLRSAGLPVVYRVHEDPDPDRLRELADLLRSRALWKGRGALTARELGAALARSAGRPEEKLVHTLALRSMRQARYDADDLGHFALGFDSYLHFTSPIRRYADLVVQRALHRWLARPGSAPPGAVSDVEREALLRVAVRISSRERLAMEAERTMSSLVKCGLMARHLGEEFTGRVTGVAAHGLYVTLDRYFVEGLVHVSALPGYAEFDRRQLALVVRGSGLRYRIGDAVQIRVETADQLKGWINFSLLSHRNSDYSDVDSSGGSATAASSSARRSQSR